MKTKVKSATLAIAVLSSLLVPLSHAFMTQQCSTYYSPTRQSFSILNAQISNSSESKGGVKESEERSFRTFSTKKLDDNGLEITTDGDGRTAARPIDKRPRPAIQEQSAKPVPTSGFNVVLTHCTADFDSLASAVGMAKLWSSQNYRDGSDKAEFDSASHLPTYVVLPRGAHPSVQRFLALHKHLFPIRSLKSLPDDLSGLNRLGLVDAQRRDRIGPAVSLLEHANRITVVDHHLESDSDIECTDYVLDEVGSVSTLIVERLLLADLEDGLTEAEATLLALGIHADTGSLCYDSTTPRDAKALAWVMEQGASQVAIAEHAQSSLSAEQQSVLTQALINTNFTVVHGVTVSTVLLTADSFINGLAAVTQDALEMSSSDVYLLGLVYEPKSGGQGKKKKRQPSERIKAKLLDDDSVDDSFYPIMEAEAWKGGEDWLLRKRLRAVFDKRDVDKSGYLDKTEIYNAITGARIIIGQDSLKNLIETIDTDGDGLIDFDEFVSFARTAQEVQSSSNKKPSTLIIIGRAKPGVNMEGINLGKLLERFGGGGHAKAASATVRLNDESDAAGIMSDLVDELIETSLQEQPTVGNFMTAPVLSVKPDMTESQVEDLFTRYDVRALPVVDDSNDVVGLVTYKEVAAAKQRMWNKEQKRLRQAASEKKQTNNKPMSQEAEKIAEVRRKRGSPVKAWMKQHVKTVEASRTMAEVELMLLENDIGCIPVVEDGSMQLVGMLTRTDLLRQHRYYSSLYYHNKGFSNSIASRKPIIEQ
jgi:nanoRNase/pAp phosphatase (c-di-AMP/oligoRNAs hydrolase)/predicted transcriptional regulator